MWMKMNLDGGSDPVLLKMPLTDGVHLDCHGGSEIGRLTMINQDRFFITSFLLKTFPDLHDHSGSDNLDPHTRSTGYLFGVADGVGGAPAGERASLLVVGTLKAFVREESSGLLRPGRPDGEVVETLRRGLRRCQAALAEEVRRHPEYWGMATTLTAGVVLWPRLYVFHMGDSRAYHFRNGALRRLTRDQTYAQSLVDAGVLDSMNADRSKWKRVVLNVLGGRRVSGGDTEVHPEVYIEELRGGDVLLLCTDGLTHPLTDETIRGILLKGGSAEDICRSLTNSAREMRAKDDATVVIARFIDSKMDFK